MDKYLTYRKLNGISDDWLVFIKSWLIKYIEYTNYKIDENITIKYLSILQKNYTITSFRKRVYQIRKYSGL